MLSCLDESVSKKIWPSSLCPCSSYYCHITNYSKTECEKQKVFYFAHDFVNRESLRAWVGSSLLGFLPKFWAAVFCTAVLWRFDLAAHSRQPAQVAGCWYWLSSETSACAVNPNTYMWPFQPKQTYSMAFGSPGACIPVETKASTWPSFSSPGNAPIITAFLLYYWKQPQPTRPKKW